MTTNYSPEQKEIKEAYLSNKKIDVKYLDLITAIESIINISSNHLSNAKTIAISIDQSDISNVFYQLIEQHNLSHLIFNNDSTYNIDDATINYLRAEVKQGLNYDNITAYQLNAELINEKYKLLSDQFKTLNTSVHGDTTLSDLITIIKKYNMQGAYTDLDFNIEDPSNEKFYRLKRAIIDVQGIYDELFEIFGKSTILKVSAREDVNEDNIIGHYKTEIDNFLKKVRQLKERFSVHKEAIIKKYKHQNELKNTEHLALINKTKESLLRKKISLASDGNGGGVLSGFFKKNTDQNPYAAIYQDFISKSNLIIDQVSDMEYNDILNALNNLKNELLLDTRFQKGFGQKLTQLNKLNAEDPTIIILDSELNTLMEELNQSGLFSRVFENNVLSFVRQIDVLDEIIKEVSGIKSMLSAYPNYISWRLIIQDKDCDIYPIISALKDYPKNEWITIFEKTYFNKLVENGLVSGLPSSDESMLELIELIERQVELLPDFLRYKLFKQQQSALENLKDKHKVIYQALFKKKLPTTLSYKELYDNAPDFVKAFFLIHLYRRIDAVRSDYDLKFNFIEDIDKKDGWLNYSKMVTEDFDMIDNVSTFPLYLNHLEYSVPIEKLAPVDRLKAAKKLAKMLLSIAQDINIYQLKNANIISTLNSIDDQKAISILEESGIKIIEGNNLYDRLTESLLESRRNQYILTKNGMINSLSTDHLLWQSYVIKKCTELGITNINFWSKNEYAYEYELENLLDGLQSDKEHNLTSIENQVI